MTSERKCSKAGCGAQEIIGKPCTDFDCPQQWVHHTRAVPDVPELVRYCEFEISRAHDAGEIPDSGPSGIYVLHSQTDEIIAALKADLHDMREQRDRAMGWRDHDKERAEAAEAKLAQYEAQEPVAWVDENGMAAFTLGGISKVHTQFETSKSERFCFPLYTSPAPAADLKADLERKDAALRFYADTSKYPAPLTGGMGALWGDCGQIARAALNAEASNDKG